MHTKTLMPIVALALLASCASKKTMLIDNTAAAGSATTKNATATATGSTAVEQLSFVQRVADNSVYAKNIVADATFRINIEGKEVSVPAKVRMRRGEVIRLQLLVPLLGTEVGRLEFTPKRVLAVDRMHKEYIEEDYSKVAFLAQNGLSFHTLEALFWNQLFLPGKESVSESALRQFTPDLTSGGTTVPVTLQNGSMSYCWNTDRTTARIVETDATYGSTTHGTSQLVWKYSDFRTMGVKQFPAKQQLSLTATVNGKHRNVEVSIAMSSMKNSDDWEAVTTVSAKYKRVEAGDILKKIASY